MKPDLMPTAILLALLALFLALGVYVEVRVMHPWTSPERASERYHHIDRAPLFRGNTIVGGR